MNANYDMQDTRLELSKMDMEIDTGRIIDDKNMEQKKTSRRRRRKSKETNHALCKDTEFCDQGAQKETFGENLILEKMEISKSEIQETLLDVDLNVQSPVQKHRMDTTGSVVEKSTEKRKARRRRRAHKNGLQSMDQIEIVSAPSLSNKPKDAERNELKIVLATNQELRLSARENSGLSDSNEERFKSDPVAIDIVGDSLMVSHPSPERIPVARLRRKLLILDVNGLLADVVSPPPKECKADVNISRRAIFKRPFCCDFLNFCFERFDVGIWSSRSKKILDRVVDYLLGDMKHRLLFFWDMSQCTETQFKTLENKHKPIVFKDLRKIWEKSDPKLPWENGDYNESNTLLLDDSPYKALLNPVHTGVFPISYTYKDSSDNSLGPGGNLRVYLEGLANADNWKEYVENHPFGQCGINESSSCWAYYSQVLSTPQSG